MMNLEQFHKFLISFRKYLISSNYIILCSIIILSLLVDMNGRVFYLSQEASFVSMLIILVIGLISALILVFTDSKNNVRWLLVVSFYLFFALHIIVDP